MISFEIKRERPKSTYQHIRDILRRPQQSFDAATEAVREEQERLRRQRALAEGEKVEPLPPRFTNPNPQALWVPQAQQNRSHGSWEETAIGMGKLQFASWLSRMVYPKFPKGTLVTLRVSGFVLNTMPYPVWTVIDLQEIYYMANIDRETREPKVVGCWAYGGDRIPTYYPPSKLRVLQPEEVRVYNDYIRDKEAKREQRAAADDTRVCGEDGANPPADAGENS